MILHGNDEVGRAMRSPVVTVRPTTTLRSAAMVFRDHDIGAVAVTDHDELVGVLSERDLAGSLGDGRDPDATLVATAMTDMPRVVETHSPLWAATKLMLRMGVRHLPVTDHDRAVGMLSIRDALAVMARDRIIEPGPLMATAHDALGPTSRTGHRVEEDVMTVSRSTKRRSARALLVLTIAWLVWLFVTSPLRAALRRAAAIVGRETR